MSNDIKELMESPFFSDIDRYFAAFTSGLSRPESRELILASFLVSSQTGKGDICLDIGAIAGRAVNEVYQDIENDTILPEKENWISTLRKSPAVGQPGQYRPLILDDNGRLYLYRYWNYERIISENIKSKLAYADEKIDFELLKTGILRLFPAGTAGETDWQKVAAINAVLQRFCVISGGPGTGKTSTVVKILVLLIEQSLKNGRSPSIALIAPTGKAAVRLKESIKTARDSIEAGSAVKNIIPEESFTIHRLLGTIYGSPYFRHNEKNQLNHDIIIVDESSMADLALLAKLISAVRFDARLIMLGDRDQLSSVEAGAALGDIADTGNTHNYSSGLAKKIKMILSEIDLPAGIEPRISDSIVILTKSYRFGRDSGIGLFSSAVREARPDDAIDILRSNKYPDIVLYEHGSSRPLADILNDYAETTLKPYLQAHVVDDIFTLFFKSTILCAVRNGPYGLTQVNNQIEKILKAKGLIDRTNRWYNGRPVMVTRNDYHLRLFNGDIGIIFNDIQSENRPRFFHQYADGTVKKILPLKLPEHETVYAMTVHKSQGSEFDNVLLILPERTSPVLTRELLYTAITRARKNVKILGDENIMRQMINMPTVRISGLRDALWGEPCS